MNDHGFYLVDMPVMDSPVTEAEALVLIRHGDNRVTVSEWPEHTVFCRSWLEQAVDDKLATVEGQHVLGCKSYVVKLTLDNGWARYRVEQRSAEFWDGMRLDSVLCHARFTNS